MKKRDMILDFTSLLDVILIILFLVVCSMNTLAKADAEELEALESEKALIEQQAFGLKTELAMASEDNEKLRDEVSKAVDANQKLMDEKEDLLGKQKELLADMNKEIADKELALEQLEKLKEMSELDSVDSAQYEVFLARAQKMTLICTKADRGCDVGISLDGESITESVLLTKDTAGLTEPESGEARLLADKVLSYVTDKKEVLALSLVYENRTMYRFAYQIIENAINLVRSDLEHEIQVWYAEVQNPTAYPTIDTTQ